MRQLEAELLDTREDLQNTIEELETSNEELKASNEEMMSMNEELQSSNEELETSKEELQSMNEELNTVNAELREKVQELERANNDMANLMNSTDVATVFLDEHLAIRRFTPTAKQLFNLIPSDVGRPIGDLTMRFSDKELQNHASEVMETLTPFAKEVKTDEGRWFIRRILPFRTHDNHVNGLVLTFTDVTVLKKSEISLKKSERRLRQAQAMANLGYWDWYMEGNRLFWSDEVYRIFGQDPNRFKVSMQSFEDTIHPDDSQVFMREIEKALSEKRDITIEHRIILPNCDIRYVNEIIEVILDKNGEVVQVAGTVQDITGRKLAVQELEKNQNLLAQAEKVSNIGSWEREIASDIVHWSEGLFHIFGLDPAKGAPKWSEHPVLFVPEDFERLRLLVDDCNKNGTPYEAELRIISPDGEIRQIFMWGQADRNLNGNIHRQIGVAQDITDRKRIESELKLIYDAIENSPQGYDIVNEDQQFTYVNRSYLKMWGYDSKEELLGTSPVSHCTDPHLPKIIISTVNEKGSSNFEFKAQRKDGSVFDVRMKVSYHVDMEGKRLYHGFSEDITERKQAEEALKDSEERLRAFLDNSTVIAWLKDEEGRYVFLSRNYEKRFGVSIKEWLGKSDFEVWPLKLAEEFHKNDQNVLEKNKPLETIEYTVDEDGNKTWWLTHKFIFTDSAGRRYVGGLGVDITERKQTEQILQNALAEKEILLREVHHRVKNNMQIISSLLRLHSRRVENEHSAKIFDDCRDRIEAMSLIHEALYQSKDLTRINIEKYLKKLCINFSRSYNISSKNIQVMVDKQDLFMNLDQGIAIGLVISELISNAFKHAFPNGKNGTVSVRLSQPDSKTVELVVSDDGAGLPKEMDIQNTSSLGLRLVTGIVTHDLGGSIEVENDSGARFVIRFKGDMKQHKGDK